ncbi:MAG: hypothetical protein CMF80_08005 [Candidatus Marinimicrobia bacterium]|nr:hypothetical protein [Candidatus Neomarinimicrobiota bacterium]
MLIMIRFLFFAIFSLVYSSFPLNNLIVGIWPEYDHSGVLVSLQIEADSSNIPFEFTLSLPSETKMAIETIGEGQNKSNNILDISNNIDSTHKYLNLDINNNKTLLQFYFNPFDRNSNEREIKYFLKTNLDLENFYVVVQKHIGADAFKTNLNNIEEISDEFGVKYLRSKIAELNSSDSLLIKVNYINFSKRTTIDILNDKFVDDKDNVNIEKNVNKVKSNKSEYDQDKYFNNKLKIFFLLSLFTIIVIIIYSLYFNRSSDLDKFVTCKHCQKIIKQTDNFCPFCGGENVS